MKVSIIIACYNHGKFLTQSVKSALNQDYPNLEIVIANDGSTDNSLEVANSFKVDSRVVVISTENQGVVATRNQAIWLSSGDYILPLDADDYLASDDVVSEMVKSLEESKSDLIFGNYQCFGGSTDLIKPELKSQPNLLIKCFISATSLFTKDIFFKVGGYSEKMKDGYEDWEFSIRAAANGKINKIEKTIFFYRIQQVSRNKSANKISTNLFETIIANNQQIYLSHMSEILMLFRNDNDKLRKSLKAQKNIKKLLIFSVVLMGLLLVAFKI